MTKFIFLPYRFALPAPLIFSFAALFICQIAC